MSVDAENQGRIPINVEAQRDWRQGVLRTSVEMLGALVDVKVQPINVADHVVEVRDVSQDASVNATYLVRHTLLSPDEDGKRLPLLEERYAVNAGFAALTGYSKIDLKSYEENEGLYLQLGMQRATEGLSDEDELLFEMARDDYAKLNAQREGTPQTELSDAEQAMHATTMNSFLRTVHASVMEAQRSKNPMFATV
jgi:hypothetical protein